MSSRYRTEDKSERLKELTDRAKEKLVLVDRIKKHCRVGENEEANICLMDLELLGLMEREAILDMIKEDMSEALYRN